MHEVLGSVPRKAIKETQRERGREKKGEDTVGRGREREGEERKERERERLL